MARWKHKTSVYPELWRQTVGFDACAWNGVYDGQTPQSCESWFQYPWQSVNMRAGRDSVGQAVLQAESRLAQRLGFMIAPTYIVGVEIPYPKNGHKVKLPHGYVQALGTEARDTIAAGAAIAYAGAPGPYDLDTTGTVTVAAGALTDVCEVAVYHPGVVAAGTITDNDESWRIYPIDIQLTGGNFEITFRRCDLVAWSAHEAQAAGEAIDIDSAAFLSTVDVFRRYTQPGGAVAVWRACGSECDEVTQSLCGIIKDKRLGIVQFYPATYSGGAWTRQDWNYCAIPEKVRVSYLAGWRSNQYSTNCDKFGDLAEIVVMLALTLMREDVCQCDQLSWLWDSARKEIELTTSTLAAVVDFFGSTMQGALAAYNWWKDHAIARGGKLTNG